MKRIASGSVAILCIASVHARAMTEPTPGKLDPRMTTAAYDPAQVYAVHVGQGQTYAVALCPSDDAREAFGADKDTLKAAPSGNTVILGAGSAQVAPRPIFIRASTKDGGSRTYAILVDTKPVSEAALSLAFTCPAEDRAKQAAAWQAAKTAKEQKAAEAALSQARGDADGNFKYTLQGEKVADWDLLPTRQVSDDGASTHFRFPGNMRVPIIYAMTPDGHEAVSDYTFDSKTGVATVHQLARQFRLRDGDALLCVRNLAFDAVGVRSETGTASPNVERVVK